MTKATRLDEALFDGKAGRGSTRGNPELLVNRRKVCANCPGRNHELFSHLFVSKPLRNQAHDFNFPFG